MGIEEVENGKYLVTLDTLKGAKHAAVILNLNSEDEVSLNIVILTVLNNNTNQKSS